MKRLLFVTTLFLLLYPSLFSTENRVQALTGQGTAGAAIVADSWCDPFYISPSLATLYDRTLLITDDSFKLNYYGSIQPDGFTSDRFAVNYNHKADLFLPLKRFRLAFDVNLKLLNRFTLTQPDPNSRQEFLELFLEGNSLFAWQLTEIFSFGFLLGGGSQVYNNNCVKYEYNTYTYSGLVVKTLKNEVYTFLKNYTLRENIGFTISKKRFTTTLSLPFSFSSIEWQYDQDSEDYAGQFDYTHSVYNFGGGLESLSDFKVKENFGVRFNAAITVEGAIYSRVYDKRSVMFSYYGYESLDYRQITFKSRAALTFNHYLSNKKHHLFYGITLQSLTYDGKGEEKTVPVDYMLTGNINMIDLNLHFGGEVRPSSKLALLFGLKATPFFFEYYKLSNYNANTRFYLPEKSRFFDDLEPGYYEVDLTAISSPLDVDISFGLEIYPLPGFTIELNTALLNISPGYSKVRMDGPTINRDFESFQLQAQFDLGFVWDFTELRRNN